MSRFVPSKDVTPVAKLGPDNTKVLRLNGASDVVAPLVEITTGGDNIGVSGGVGCDNEKGMGLKDVAGALEVDVTPDVGVKFGAEGGTILTNEGAVGARNGVVAVEDDEVEVACI